MTIINEKMDEIKHYSQSSFITKFFLCRNYITDILKEIANLSNGGKGA